jgi:hypothetical protein
MYCAHAALPHLLAAAEDSPRRVADLVNISSVAGRVARSGAGRLQRHQVRRRRVQRVAAPGGHPPPRARLARRARRRGDRAGRPQPPEVLETLRKRFGDMERLQSEDIADAIPTS